LKFFEPFRASFHSSFRNKPADRACPAASFL
jgi:hypothetical protein